MTQRNPLPTLIGMLLCATATTVMAASDAVDYRLPGGIVPTAQAIELTLDPGAVEFSGSTVIQIEVERPVERIGIYQLGLEMTAITLRSAGAERVLQATVADYDINWLSDGAPIPAGEYELSIEFDGNYASDALGMHRTRFEDNDYVFTQMESMYLRRAVPSFDEPSFKLPYQLTINAPAGLTVVANTPVAAESTSNGWQRVEFQPTRPLSSYLIAYAVGPLERVALEGMSVPGFIYVPRGHADELGFVLRHTPPIVAELEDYFGMPYPFEKLDFIAVPEFAYGAMENPGLITYRAEYLLLGDHAAGASAAWTLSTIAHEVAHMWFGDLVTMQWWNDLWLNEAFATWMNDVIMLRLYPEFETELTLPQTRAFSIDQNSATKPIRKEVRRDTDASENAELAYFKGQTVLAMLEAYVGADKWQEGVRRYIRKFAWSNATEPDLWNEISAASGMDVGQIAGAYLNQPGFPLLTIDENGAISQSRYLPYGLTAADHEWIIPLNIKYRKDGKIGKVFYLLDSRTGQIDLPQGSDWIMPDAGAAGYFRWQVNPDQFQALVADLGSLDNGEKIALLDNSYALLRARRLSFEDYMLVITSLLKESHPLVLLPAVNKVIQVGDMFVNDDNAAAFARFVDAALADHFARIGIKTRPGDSEAIIQLRPRLLRALGQYGDDAAVRTAAAAEADLYLASPEAVDANLAVELLRVTALHDDGGRYQEYMDAYRKSTDANQKVNILRAIYFRDPGIISRALDFSISDAVLAGHASYALALYPTILQDHTILYAWLEKNLAALEAKTPGYTHARLPLTVSGICNEKNLALMQAFFAARDAKYAISLKNTVEAMNSCIAERKRDGAALRHFLAQYDKRGGVQ